MPEITRKLEFDAGHRVLHHEGKCRHLHGHRYVVELTVSADKSDSLGRVIDFGVIKNLVGGWIDENLDHNMILHPDDALLRMGADRGQSRNEAIALIGREPFLMPPDTNPTAENIVEMIAENAIELLEPYEITIVRVRLYETPNCWADWTTKDN
ncbi:MAG: 6-carboxytetrahydropterin synthase [Fuerstiella sp.]|nr:6-carboxytetrahydropterin synthase [Fuerstiella sp.]MCP4859457.1 6-carboxytetrahydropterin synthase [Fuerstiella sp.]